MAREITPDQEIWVFTSEGAALTQYSREYLEKLAYKNWRLPENERIIQTRKRAGRYELWLPDLLHYKDEIGNGPLNIPKK